MSLFPFITFAADVHIDITGVNGGVGQIIVSVWDSEDNYLNRVFMTKVALVNDLNNDKIRVTLTEPLPEKCVINVFHDINMNGELDTNWIGIPNEPVGITNNVKGRFGPPEYADAEVKISWAEQVFDIHVEGI
ncbi:DUF2141 domain-containing protein [Moritella dasanensis]|uniref:DUF2141 domain-containing protein n=1 Tax=Moritella dasanensis TaxID=428031 RepID=UPI0012FCC67B|nr:DUF2141 domain-containing protein [Moritella dasanensis]